MSSDEGYIAKIKSTAGEMITRLFDQLTVKVPWSELHFPITKCITKCNSDHGHFKDRPIRVPQVTRLPSQ